MYLMVENIRVEQEADPPEWNTCRETFRMELSEPQSSLALMRSLHHAGPVRRPQGRGICSEPAPGPSFHQVSLCTLMSHLLFCFSQW